MQSYTITFQIICLLGLSSILCPYCVPCIWRNCISQFPFPTGSLMVPNKRPESEKSEKPEYLSLSFLLRWQGVSKLLHLIYVCFPQDHLYLYMALLPTGNFFTLVPYGWSGFLVFTNQGGLINTYLASQLLYFKHDPTLKPFFFFFATT